MGRFNLNNSKNAEFSVSVVIINWNSTKLLKNCIKCLNRQKLSPDQVFVVDNASDDDSKEFFNNAKNFTPIQLEKNSGFAAGNNRAIIDCNTEFVALLNPDAFPDNYWLQRLVEAAKQNPEVAAFGSKQLCFADKEIIDGIGDCYHISGLVWRKGYGRIQNSQDLISREIFSPCAAAAMYRRSVLEKVGGFDEDYFCYVEDVDLGFRIRLAGYKAIYVPDAVVYHVGSATTGSQHSDFAVYHGHRNIVWTFIKNMPGLLFYIFIPLHILQNIAAIIKFSVRGQCRIILSAKLDSIKAMKMVLKKRKKIQKMRNVKIGDIWKILDKQFLPKRQ